MRKPNKGFTLVELLAVIVILAILMVIAIPQMFGTINRSKNRNYNTFIENIESSANNYVLEFMYDSTMLSFDENGKTIITLQQLVDNGFVKQPIKDPRNGYVLPLTIGIEVVKTTNNFKYDFLYGDIVDEGAPIPPVS